jgi:hypothetical protein
LQESPNLLKFLLMDLGPGLNQTLLRLWQPTTDALYGIDREHGRRILVHRVEVGPMMGRADLHEHANDDAEESR